MSLRIVERITDVLDEVDHQVGDQILNDLLGEPVDQLTMYGKLKNTAIVIMDQTLGRLDRVTDRLQHKIEKTIYIDQD